MPWYWYQMTASTVAERPALWLIAARDEIGHTTNAQPSFYRCQPHLAVVHRVSPCHRNFHAVFAPHKAPPAVRSCSPIAKQLCPIRSSGMSTGECMAR